MKLTAVICSHNPREDHLRRALELIACSNSSKKRMGNDPCRQCISVAPGGVMGPFMAPKRKTHYGAGAWHRRRAHTGNEEIMLGFVGLRGRRQRDGQILS